MRHASVLFLSLYLLLVTSQPVFGGGITNFTWDPQIDSYILDVKFGAVEGAANDPQNTHVINVGGLWKVNITVLETPATVGGFGQDSVSIIGSTQHVVAPHTGDAPNGLLQPIDFSFLAPLTIPPNGLITPSLGPLIRDHPGIGHTDVFELRVLAHVSGSFGFRDIDDWELIMTGVHVPEPTTLLLVGTVLALLGATAWRRQHRHK